MAELKPCPFCGMKAEIFTISIGSNSAEFLATFAVRCPNCKVGFKYDAKFCLKDGKPVVMKDGYQQCVNDWNRRAEDGK